MEYLKGYVTIIVPCFNGGRFVHRFFDSLINQTYKKIQLIFVDDGSTDNTKAIYQKYYPLFNKEGYKCEYVFQENQGQAAAINVGLKLVDGEFLMWMDSDDYIAHNHVERKVNFLIHNNIYQIVMCEGSAVDESHLDEEVWRIGYKDVTGNVFEDILFDYCGCTGALFLVRTCAFFSIFKDREIYISRVGQNLQMLLPLCHTFKVGALNEILFTYVIREESHSRQFKTYQEKKKRIREIIELKQHILDELDYCLEKDYLRYLRYVLYEKETLYYLKLIDEYKDDIYENDCEMVQRIISRINNKKKVLMWGYSDRYKRIEQFFNRCGKLVIGGYVDSNTNKQGKNVIAPNEINPLSDFILIFLEYHEEIVKKLDELGMYPNVDYYYPAYGIIEAMKKKKITLEGESIGDY